MTLGLRWEVVDFLVRVILVPLIAAAVVTIPAILNVWEGLTEIAGGFVVAYFAVFVVAMLQHRINKAGTQKPIQNAIDRMMDRWLKLSA